MATVTATIPSEFSVAEIAECLCGQPDCFGHERVPHPDKPGVGKIYVPGFTSRAAMSACPNEIVVFDRELKPHVLAEALRILNS